MREFDQQWSSNASTGGQAAVQVTGDVMESAWYCEASAGSTNGITIQTGPNSTGPWFNEASTVLAVSGGAVLRVTGPFIWVRPYWTSTGGTVRCVGVS